MTSVALAVQLYSVDYLRGDPRYPSYVALVSLFTSAMLLVVAADDLLVLLVGWEVMGICSYFLIGHFWELAEARDGAVKAFLVTRLGDIGFLFGIFVLATAADTFRISEIQELAGKDGLTTGTATLATLLLLCGVVGKSAQFPLHLWLPDAMAGPTPVSALIHAATMVAAGVFLVARLLAVFERAPATLAVLAVVAAITMVGSALAALAEEDVKRVLAWSTVSQLAYMLAGLAAGGYAAGVLLLVAHGAFKALLFLCAGALIHAVGSNLMSSMGGLRRALPVTFVTMTIGLAALAALPPLSGFFAKDAVLGAIQEALTHGGPLPVWAAWVILLAGFGDGRPHRGVLHPVVAAGLLRRGTGPRAARTGRTRARAGARGARRGTVVHAVAARRARRSECPARIPGTRTRLLGELARGWRTGRRVGARPRPRRHHGRVGAGRRGRRRGGRDDVAPARPA